MYHLRNKTIRGSLNLYFLFGLDNCFTTLEGNSGLFSTNGFPDKYAANSNCTWQINVPEDHKIKLTFHLIDVSIIIYNISRNLHKIFVCLLYL